MRLHVVSLPHTNTTKEFNACAYTEKVRRFCIMMKSLGHTVYLYAGEQNEAPCDELITCISEKERSTAVGELHYTSTPFDPELKHWKSFHHKVTRNIRERVEPKDFICVISGRMAEPIAKSFPEHLTVEFGIGYSGIFSPYRVWESYAWMHTCYGAATGGHAERANGEWFEAVIPGYLELEDFTYQEDKEDYYLYLGRMIDRKGIAVAAQVCKEAGKRLILAGPGQPPDYGEYVGSVGPEERRKLLSGAKALIMPTLYIEPFGNVAVEAMASGTPVICTDWGAMTETVIQGSTGFRCRCMKEFLEALDLVETLNPKVCRKHVEDNYSLEATAPKYDKYFTRLETLFGAGWYAK